MHRRSAINIETLSKFPAEREVLILRYVPFRIMSIEVGDAGRTDIYLTQYSEQANDSNQSTTNNDILTEPGLPTDTFFQLNLTWPGLATGKSNQNDLLDLSDSAN